MLGQLVLQGGGPFISNDELDARVLQGLSGYVAVLPTAEAFENPAVLIATSVVWAQRMGVETKLCAVYTRADAREDGFAQIIRDAAAVYVVGDSPIHLRTTLQATVVYEAIEQQIESGIVVAVAGSAAALCDPMVDPRGGAFTLGLGLVEGIAVITESETWSHDRLQRSLQLANTTVVQLPTGSALLYNGGKWNVDGPAIIHGALPN
jgi:cyanophycinase